MAQRNELYKYGSGAFMAEGKITAKSLVIEKTRSVYLLIPTGERYVTPVYLLNIRIDRSTTIEPLALV